MLTAEGKTDVMLSSQKMLTLLLLLLLLLTLAVGESGDSQESSKEGEEQSVNERVEVSYCSFFNNRAPKAQPGLKNCTWFKENSCCMQQEIEATFGRVKPLKGASLECQRYINYLMCYICAPNQNIFYKRERLTVCESFCDSLYSVCGSAVLKGSVIRDLYPGGKEFCMSRRFEVDSVECFAFDILLDTSSASKPTYSVVLYLAITLCLLTLSELNFQKFVLSDVNSEDIMRKRHRTYHKTVEKKWIDTLFLVVLLLVHFQVANGDLTRDDVKLWANKLSTEINDIAERRLHYRELQQLYDTAQYATDYINGTTKLLELQANLESYFEKKYRLAHALAEEVRRLHDDWLIKRQEEEEKRKEQLSRIKQQESLAEGAAQRDAFGLRDMLYKTANSDTFNYTSQNRTLNDLSIDIYKDADFISRMPKQYLTYEKRFGQLVMMNYSSVKIPDVVERDDPSTIDTVEWTAPLEEVFRKNSQADSEIMWQYFGSTTGVYRVFPGYNWPSNFAGFTEDYDPRVRPWYVAAASGPKNVVLVLDASMSMGDGNNFPRMKEIASHLLNTLNILDRVNVVVSRSGYWSTTGKYHNNTASVLGCRNSTLLAASPAYRQELITAIDQLDPYGGSDHIQAFRIAFDLLQRSTSGDCQSLIIFITDGNKYDRNQRCTSGYYKYDTESRRRFNPGELCAYDFENVIQVVNKLQYQIPRRAQMFTFVTDPNTKSQLLPGQLACYNNGDMAKIVQDEYILDQMLPYFQFLEMSSTASELIWTSPYLDKGGLGLVITAALPVYSNITDQHIGVIAIDTPISFLETRMKHSRWGDAYAFMIDSSSGSTIVHPHTKPASQLLGNPALIPITALETHNGKPEKFKDVLKAMMQQETGNIEIDVDAQYATLLKDALLWRPAKSSHYFYTAVNYSRYSIAYHLSESDLKFQYARDPTVDGPTSYLHNMQDYAALGPAYSHIIPELQPSDILPGYVGMNVTMEHSLVKLSPRSFCHPLAFLTQDTPSMQEIHEYINTFTPSYDTPCPEGSYQPDARADVKMTAQLEELWMDSWDDSDLDVIWVYAGTVSGVFRMYPGVQLNKEFDATSREWYYRSMVHRGQVAVSSVMEDAAGLGKIISLGWAIHKTKPLTPPDCTVAQRDYGCPCDYNYECKSEYCYESSCADDLIQGVVAMDVTYDSFHNYIHNIIKDLDPDHYCGKNYTCHDSLCETRCYIVNDRAHLVMAKDFPDMVTAQRKYETVSLATRHGYIMSELIKYGIFVKKTRVEYQSKCVLSTFVPEDIPSDRQWMPSYFMEGEEDIPGPIPPFQNYYSCIKEVIYYLARKSYTEQNESYVISGSLDDDPCAAGTYHFTRIPGTNLYLLVIDEFQDYYSQLNLNCHITNRILSPGHFRLEKSPCEYGNFISGHQPRPCSISQRPIACQYGAAPSVTSSILLTLWLTFIARFITISSTVSRGIL